MASEAGQEEEPCGGDGAEQCGGDDRKAETFMDNPYLSVMFGSTWTQ